MGKINRPAGDSIIEVIRHGFQNNLGLYIEEYILRIRIPARI